MLILSAGATLEIDGPHRAHDDHMLSGRRSITQCSAPGRVRTGSARHALGLVVCALRAGCRSEPSHSGVEACGTHGETGRAPIPDCSRFTTNSTAFCAWSSRSSSSQGLRSSELPHTSAARTHCAAARRWNASLSCCSRPSPPPSRKPAYQNIVPEGNMFTSRDAVEDPRSKSRCMTPSRRFSRSRTCSIETAHAQQVPRSNCSSHR